MKLNFIFYIILLLSIESSYSYSIGISPDSISFDKPESSFVIFNQNFFTINYSIKGCEYDFFEILRDGMIQSGEKREIKFRYNNKLNKIIENCNLNIFFDNNVYATAFSIPVKFEKNNLEHTYLLDSNNTQIDENNHENTSKLPIILLSLIFLVSLFLIIKFF